MDQKQVESWMASGKGRRLHCDDGLYLCRNAKGFSWALIWMKDGKRREAGLGAYREGANGLNAFRLREARWETAGTGKLKREGKDIIEERRRAAKARVAAVTTFGDVAEMYIKDVGSRLWKDADRMGDEFRRVVKTYCKSIEKLPVGDVSVADVKKVLSPWVETRPTMAASVASVIRRVIDTAIAHELRGEGVNPADKRILSKVLTMQHKTQHHPAMPWKDAPAFYATLGDDVPERALRVLMLTALRRNEVAGLRWDEVDLDHCLLTIGAARMKAKRDHIVPLSVEACTLLRTMPEGRGKYVFPSPRIRNAPISHTSLAKMMPDGATPHGMRATFRTWAEDHGIDPTLAEHALAHSVGDKTQQAYRRGTAVELRREVMQKWADHLTGEGCPA
jgi:integrase